MAQSLMNIEGKMDSNSKSAFKVLIIDDYPLMCQLIKDSLVQLSSVSCVVKNDVQNANHFLKLNSVNLAIIDLNLGDSSGLQIIQRIRSGLYLTKHDIPILIVSGNTYKDNIKDCVLFDIQEIITKPVQPSLLKQRVEKYINFKTNTKPANHYAGISLFNDSNIQKPKQSTIMRDSEPSNFHMRSRNQGVVVENTSSTYDPVLHWPEATTGKYQIDSRLNKICYSFNMLIYLSLEKKQKQSIHSLTKTLLETIDNVLYLTKKLSRKEPQNEAWPELAIRLSEFKELPLGHLSNQQFTAKNIEEVNLVAKSIWLKVTSKPVFHKITES